MTKNKIIIIGALLLAGIAGGVYYFYGRGYRKFMAVETIQVDPQFTVYLGGGGNSIVLVSEDGARALVVDTKMGDAAKKLRVAIRAGEIIVVNTHAHRDHTGGNPLYAGSKIIAGAYSREQWDDLSKKSRFPDVTIKPGEEVVLQIGSEKARVRNLGRAHTWDDLVVYLENRKVLVTGDLVFLNMHPALMAASGANVQAWLKVLDELNRYDISRLVPGHGKLSDKSAIPAMKDYFISIGGAVGNKDKQEALKEKYKDYFSMPGMLSFDKTLAFIENERKSN